MLRKLKAVVVAIAAKSRKLPAWQTSGPCAALHFHSIECAILLGCQYYDFGHGDEEYKFSYGAEKTSVQYFSIRRPNASPEKVFDSISTGAALKRVERLIKAGETDQAKRACRQLSQIFQ